ncbi:hypothetical protein TrispH2_011739 [Trichoplax sp. H2]|nr:hypothetical protein TrispH2_011739 [Trichoplax sp. H2]|eukprot:RDD36079.1 hypothetical protein TrispH2_011739 [Trichoplax sp. H2]
MQVLRASSVVLPFSYRLSGVGDGYNNIFILLLKEYYNDAQFAGKINRLTPSIWSAYSLRSAATSAEYPGSLSGVNFFVDQSRRANVPNTGHLAGALSSRFMNETFGLFKDGTKPLLKSVKMTIDPNFYNFHYGLLGNAMVKLTNFNKNAFKTLCEMTLGDDKSLLCKVEATTEVTQDHKLHAISDDVTEELRNSQIRDDLKHSLINLEKLGLPSEPCMISSVEVRPSDLDENRNVNWAQMLSYCQHGIRSAISSKKFQVATRMSSLAQIKELHLDITGKVSVGDTVDISVYENIELNRILCIGKCGEEIVCKGYLDLDREIAGELPQWRLPMHTESDVCVHTDVPSVGFHRDRFNNVILEYVKEAISNSRFNCYLAQGYLKGHLLEDAIQVIFTHRIKIDPELFKIDQFQDLKHELKLLNLGKSSFIVNTDLQLHDKVLISIASNIVNFSMKNGKGVPFTDWHQKTFSEYRNKLGPHEVNMPSEIPKDAYKHTFYSRYDDLDYQHIIKNSRYFTFCFDVAANAIYKRSPAYHTGFTYDFNPNCVREFDICYVNHCRESQQLEITTFQNHEDPQKLHFLLTKGDKTICYCNMTIDLNSSKV